MNDGQDEVHELTDLLIDTVGLVGKAANRRKYLLFKSDNKPEEDMSDEQETPTVETLEGVVEQAEKAEDVGGLKKAFAGLVSLFSKQQEAAVEPDSEPEAVPEAEPVKEVEGAVAKMADFTKALGELNAQLAKAQERAEEAETIAKKERDLRIQAEYVAKAEALAIPGEVADLAEMLRKADEAGIGEVLGGILEAASNAVVQSGMIEKGTTQVDNSTDSEFMKAVEVRKAALRENDPTLSEAEAFSKAYDAIGDEQPDLAKRYIAERQSATGRR